MLCRFEDLPVPTVVAINGVCLGGGLELALACDYRVMSTAASVGFPEVKLGIFPGFGGSVRMPRVIGVDNAVEWICAGADKKPDAALKDGAVDAVVAPEQLRDAALAMLKQAIAGRLDWKSKRAEKLAPIKLNQMESMMAFTAPWASSVRRPARTTRRRCSQSAACRSPPRRGVTTRSTSRRSTSPRRP